MLEDDMNAEKRCEDIAESAGHGRDRLKPERPWRDIAKEVSTEHDSHKVAELSQELLRALDKQRLEQTPKHDSEHIQGESA